jgi:hypothetical protein
MMKILSALAFAALMLWTASASAQSGTRNWFWSGPGIGAGPITPAASSRQPKATKPAKSRNARR